MRISPVIAMLLLGPVGTAAAQPVISLSSGNLSALRLGDPITIDVALSGLASGDTLELLAAEIVFDATRFGLPTISPDVIIPDIAGFVADEFPGLAGATFDMLDTTSGSDRITTNGLFFTFQIVPRATGSGQIAVDFADALGEEAGGNPIDGALAGAPLAYQIVPDCDFDGDGLCDSADIDALVAEIASSGSNLLFDLDGDGMIDTDDLAAWRVVAGEENLGAGRVYLVGDATLDAIVDGSDFNRWNTNKFTAVPAWSAGDFNADGVVDGSDFNLWNTNKFQSSDATVVPEPVGWVLALTVLFRSAMRRPPFLHPPLDTCFRSRCRTAVLVTCDDGVVRGG